MKKLKIRKHLGVLIWWVLMDVSLTRDEQETIHSFGVIGSIFDRFSDLFWLLSSSISDKKWLFKYLWIYSIIHFIFIGKTSTDLEAGQEKRETSELLIFNFVRILVMRHETCLNMNRDKESLKRKSWSWKNTFPSSKFHFKNSL